MLRQHDAYVSIKAREVETFSETGATVGATLVAFGTAMFPITARDSLLTVIDRHNEIKSFAVTFQPIDRFSPSCDLPGVFSEFMH